MIKVAIIGAISAKDEGDYLYNLGRGVDLAASVAAAGFAPSPSFLLFFVWCD